jgi:hypothetical protein
MDAKLKCKPFSRDYVAIDTLLTAIDETADLVTGQRWFFNRGIDPTTGFRTPGGR